MTADHFDLCPRGLLDDLSLISLRRTASPRGSLMRPSANHIITICLICDDEGGRFIGHLGCEMANPSTFIAVSLDSGA